MLIYMSVGLCFLLPLPAAAALQKPAISHEVSELAEMKSIFQQMQDMTDRNSAFVELLSKAVITVSFLQAFASNEELAGQLDCPNLDNVSHEN